ncbi:MAG TPA: aromatic ring-opening dioxygenase subunit LigB [Thermomicrobiales bacterium]|jgi:aromatic ring-opening dioxygenase LigB subunit
MAGIVFAGVAPHGWPTIPDLSEDALGALQTRAALQELGRRCAAASPDAIVVATPHGVRVDGTICLAAVARGTGTLRHDGRTVESNVPVDAPLTGAIAAAARARGVPVALAGFGGNNPAESAIPLDWGTMVPLWFVGHGRNLIGHGDVLAPDPAEDLGPPVVIATPSRSLPRPTIVEFGVAVAEAATREGRRVAFVASCDWAHTHEGGRYGVHPVAAEVDAAVVAALRDNDPGRLLDLDPQLAEDAAIDGLWQTLILAGVMRHVPMRGDVLSYEAPPAYATGMIVAAFAPAAEDRLTPPVPDRAAPP